MTIIANQNSIKGRVESQPEISRFRGGSVAVLKVEDPEKKKAYRVVVFNEQLVDYIEQYVGEGAFVSLSGRSKEKPMLNEWNRREIVPFVILHPSEGELVVRAH